MASTTTVAAVGPGPSTTTTVTTAAAMKPLNGTDVAKRHSAEPEALADIVKRRAAEAGLLKERPLLEQQILALPSVAEGLVRPVHQETATLEAAIRLFGAHIEPPSAGRHFAADGILDVDADGDHAGAAATVKPDDLIEVAKVKDRDVGVEVTLLAKPTITPSTCAGDKLVRGFNGLPGVGPWAIGGYIRVKSLKEAKKPLELSKISVKLDAVMAGRRMVAKSNEAFVLYPHFYARLVALPVVVLGQNTTIPVGGEYFGTFRFQFTQVYPPALDLITLCAHDTKNVVLYRLGVTIPGPFGQLSLLYDVPVQLFSVNLIRGWLTDTVVNPLVSMFPSSKPEILPDVHIKVGPHGWCVPGETIAIEVTVIMRPPGYSTNSASNSSAESASSIVGSISQVTVSLYEVVGFAEGSLKAGSLHPRVTVKTCVSSIAKRELNAAAEAGHQTLIWNPSAVAGAASMTATLRLRIPPPASTRSMVPTTGGAGGAKSNFDAASECVNTDGRWINTLVSHEVCVAVQYERAAAASAGGRMKQFLTSVGLRAAEPPVEYRVPVQVVGVPRAAASVIASRFPAVLKNPDEAERAPAVVRGEADEPFEPLLSEDPVKTPDLVSGITLDKGGYMGI